MVPDQIPRGALVVALKLDFDKHNLLGGESVDTDFLLLASGDALSRPDLIVAFILHISSRPFEDARHERAEQKASRRNKTLRIASKDSRRAYRERRICTRGIGMNMAISRNQWVALYVLMAVVTLIFQVYVRSSQCVPDCALSYAKAVVWSSIWPASWIVYLAGII